MEDREYLIKEIDKCSNSLLFNIVLNIEKVLTSLSFMNLISYEKFNYTGNENYLVTLAMLGTYGFMVMYEKEKIYRKESLQVRLDINEIALNVKNKYESARELLEEWFNNYDEESKSHAVFAFGDVFFGTSLFMVCANTPWVNIFKGFTLQEIGGLISGFLATRLIDNALLSSTYYRLSGDNQILLDLDDLRRERRHK